MVRAKLSLKAILLCVLLALSLIACGSSDMTTKPTPVASPDTSSEDASGISRPIVTGIRTEAAGRQTRVIVEGNQPLTYTAVLDNQPPSIVLDVGAAPGEGVLGETSVKNGWVDRIKAESIEGVSNVIRVRIALVKTTTYQVIREGSNLAVLVENAPGTAADSLGEEDLPLTAEQMRGGTARVSALDFKPVGKSGRTRLIIRTSKLVTPQVLARDNGRTVVLSMSPATITHRLVRPLDTTYFRSAVNYIKPFQANRNTVELLIRLRDIVPYHLGQKGLVTYLDFDRSSVAPRRVTRIKSQAMPEPGKPAADPQAAAEGGQVTVKSDPTKPKHYKGAKISLDFQNADIHNILRLIGEVSGKNVVVSDKVNGKVTLKLKDVPWDQALDIVLAANQLGVVESGNVLRIDKAEFLRAEKELQIKEMAQVQERAKSVPLMKKIFTPRYAAVANMKTELEKLKSERGKITVIGNDVFVEDEPSILETMAEVFARNDKVSKQILIESRIVEALSSFTKNLGINWGGDATGTETTGPLANTTWNLYGAHGTGAAGAGGAAVNLISAPAMGLALGFGLIGNAFNLDAKLYAMEQTGEGRIVSAPRILASNDEEVYIKQGQSIPYEAAGTTTAPATISYNEAVLELRVKPHIEENGKIISMDITVTKDTADYSRTTRNPPINKREAKTKLMVKNGETVVIGGIIVDEKSKSINRVPALHRIPLLGWLFKNYEVSDTKLELLIFLTSNIIPVNI